MDDMNTERLYEAVSLCYYNSYENGWNWTRLADVKNGVLVPFWYDNSRDSSLENRYWLRTYPEFEHRIGELKVISWYDEPSNKSVGGLYNKTKELDIFPIEIYDLDVHDMAQGLEKLRGGIAHGSVTHDIMYTCGDSAKGKQSIFCKAGTLEYRNGKYYLSDDTAKLPYYYLNSRDALTITVNQYTQYGQDYWFLKTLAPGVPEGYLQTQDSSDVVKNVILNSMMTWRAFGDFVSSEDGNKKYTKKELQLFKAFISKTNDKTAQQEVAEQLGCTEEEAEGFIRDFIANANTYLDGSEVDTQLLSHLVTANDELREEYTELVKERWLRDTGEIIKAKNEEIANLEKAKQEKKTELDALNADIEKNRNTLRKMQDEIESNRALAEESYSLVKDKLSAARSDVSQFLADMACYLPSALSTTPVPASGEPVGGDYTVGEDIEAERFSEKDTWEEIVGELEYNLASTGIAEYFQEALAALLYTVYRSKRPILLAGYTSEEIAQALSVSVTGKYADVLTCSGACSVSMIRKAFEDDGVLIIRNPFSGDWLDALVQESKTATKQLVFCHPYSEDLSIEPQSLFNYILPIYTDIISANEPDIHELYGARLKQDAEDFVPKYKKVVPSETLAALKVNAGLQSRMQGLFNSTKLIADSDNKSSALVYNCLLTSYADAVGRGEQLCLSVKDRNDIPKEIKEAIFRYFDYEEE